MWTGIVPCCTSRGLWGDGPPGADAVIGRTARPLMVLWCGLLQSGWFGCATDGGPTTQHEDDVAWLHPTPGRRTWCGRLHHRRRWTRREATHAMNEPAARPITRPVRLSITSPLWQPRASAGSSAWRISIANGAHDGRERDADFRGDDGSHAMASPSGMNRAMLRLMSLIHSRSASDASRVPRQVACPQQRRIQAEPAMDRRQGRDQDDCHREREQPAAPRATCAGRARAGAHRGGSREGPGRYLARTG